MTLESVSRRIESHFITIAVILSGVALAYPPSFTWIKPHIPLGLGIIMFGMGLTLEFGDFREILRKWRLVGLGVILQYTVMPLLAVGISYTLGLPPEAAVGMVVVGACPGGTASNVIAYLARANVPLSVTLTLTSTCLAPVLTPAIVYLVLEKQVHIDFWSMVQSVFWIVVFPLVDGLILRRLLRRRLEPVLRVFPSVSILVIAMVIACIIGLNRQALLAFPLLVFLAVVLHNTLGAGCRVRHGPAVPVFAPRRPDPGYRGRYAELRPGRGPGGQALRRGERLARCVVQPVAQSFRGRPGPALARQGDVGLAGVAKNKQFFLLDVCYIPRISMLQSITKSMSVTNSGGNSDED